MNNPIPALVFGFLLLLIGGVMLYVQTRGRGNEDDLSENERLYLRRRTRRRVQVAGLILLIGVMIPVGDSLIDWRNSPRTFAVYWLIVIGLAIWTGLLALGDLAATRAQMATELNRLHRHKLELRNVARRIQKTEHNSHTDK